MSLEEYPDVLTPFDICRILSISHSTAYKLLKSNKIKSIKIGRLYRIPKRFVNDFLTNSCYTDICAMEIKDCLERSSNDSLSAV